MIKYVLRPGHVRSKSDGEVHFINAQRLAELYRVPLNECAVWDSRLPLTTNLKMHTGRLALHPRNNGNYDDLPAIPL